MLYNYRIKEKKGNLYTSTKKWPDFHWFEYVLLSLLSEVSHWLLFRRNRTV